MFDQLGGGFSRYSVDRYWLVPHFEKMLYDNAQLLRTYARAHLMTGSARYREVAAMTAAWMLTELRAPGGGFWSSLDADSEGEEGKFYLWTLEEIEEATGDDAPAALRRWGFSSRGNFEGKNIPVWSPAEVDEDAVNRARAALLERRARRVRPATDTKVVAGWNALATAALAEAGIALGEPAWVQAARETFDFMATKLVLDNRLRRTYSRDHKGREVVKHLGCCEDYAFLLEAALALFEATHDLDYLGRAEWIAGETIGLFHDTESGGFYATGTDAEKLVVRPKDLFDNAVPSSNSVLALQLQRLALLTGEQSFEKTAVDSMRLVKDALVASPQGFGHMLEAIDFYAGEPLEIVIVGDLHDQDTRALMEVVQRRYVPSKVLIVSDEGDADRVARIPLLEGRTRVDDRATAYVCRRGICRLPVTAPEALVEQLGS
jgi:uncharacterized protein